LNSFQSFGLAEPIARALAEENYLVPTPIQAQTVPLALDGRDVIGIAQTGTGKTAAFALPILQQLAVQRSSPERKTCRVLVLSPTRELSSQILDSFRAYGRHLGITSALAIGGVSMGSQVRGLLNGVDVLVATPGRLIDLVQSNALRLNRVDFLVLDEADRMLDMGFIHDIRRIVAKLPSRRQTLFFSATMPQAIAELAGEMLRDPARVAVTPVASTAERVTQRVVHVERPGKTAALSELLRNEPIERALVFTRTKRGADKLVRGLANDGIGASAIHGNKSQNQREAVLAGFRQGKVRILVATDIAARGIDVEGISHVINYDLPNVPEDYVHRIGRTARAGNSGIAISLCDAEERPYLRAIEKLIRLSLPATDRLGEARNAPSAPADTRHSHRPKQRQSRKHGPAQGGSLRLTADEYGTEASRHQRQDHPSHPTHGYESKRHEARVDHPRGSHRNHAQSPAVHPSRALANGNSVSRLSGPGPVAVPGRASAQSSAPADGLSRVAFFNRGISRANKPRHRAQRRSTAGE
jgi:ATP-dependent RNA helicase RhlE